MEDHYLLQFFEYEHLKTQEMRDISKPFCDLAHHLALVLPSNPESTVVMRKLLEAKDAAVRSIIFKP